jgi:hypothetical protein
MDEHGGSGTGGVLEKSISIRYILRNLLHDETGMRGMNT